MKKLMLIVLLMSAICSIALAYRLPTAWTLGGGLGYDSVRVTIYRATTSSAVNTIVKDTSITTAGTSGINSFEVDSLVSHTVRYMYFVNPDTFREFVQNVYPVDYDKYVRAGVGAVRDSMDEASQAGSGQSLGDTLGILLSYLDAIRDSGEFYAQVGAGASGGCPDSVGNAWTIVAYDSVNSVYVPNALVTLKSSAVSAIPLAQAKSGFTFTAANGTYYVVIEANGITFPLRSFAVSGARNDTINGGGLLVSAPSSPNEATVYGTLIGGDGEIAANWDVRFTLEDVKANLSDTATGQMVVIKVVETSTNSSGYFSKGLLKTENMLYKSGTQYKHPVWRMVASPSDVKTDPRVDFTFTIPSDSTSLDLGQLIKEGAE